MSPRSGPTKTYRFEIFRHDGSPDGTARFQTFELTTGRDVSVLESLLVIQDEQDPSLAFRCSCRGAVCGACGMTINGKPRLACRTLLKSLKSERIVLEPLPNLEILKDLVVDMDPFWEKYERIQPWLHAAMQGDRERTMTEADCRRIDSFTSCILCALCYGACPVLKRNEDFTGPAALAKLYRFLSDSREQRSDETLNQENSATGLWGCHTITRCIDACPKNVRPTDGITGARRKLLASHMKSLVRKKG